MSTEKVEKVVKDPQNPTPSSNFERGLSPIGIQEEKEDSGGIDGFVLVVVVVVVVLVVVI